MSSQLRAARPGPVSGDPTASRPTRPDRWHCCWRPRLRAPAAARVRAATLAGSVFLFMVRGGRRAAAAQSSPAPPPLRSPPWRRLPSQVRWCGDRAGPAGWLGAGLGMVTAPAGRRLVLSAQYCGKQERRRGLDSVPVGRRALS